MRKRKEEIKGSIKENIRLMNTPLMSILPGQISFFVILSVIPLASLFLMFASKLSLNYDVVSNFITHYIPDTMSNIILAILEQQNVGTLDILFIITAFYLASKATHSVIIASTQIYNGKQRDFFRTRIKAILILIIFMAFALSVIAVLTLGSKIIVYLASINDSFSPYIYSLYNVLKWPFAFITIFIVIKIIYTVSPNESIPSSSVNKGALFTTVVWIVTTFVYSFYVTNIANYSKFYGNLSNLIILMIWIYWMCYVFVFGMTMNQYKLENTIKMKSLD